MSQRLDLADRLGASALDNHSADRESRDLMRPAAPNLTAALQIDVCFHAGTRGNIVTTDFIHDSRMQKETLVTLILPLRPALCQPRRLLSHRRSSTTSTRMAVVTTPTVQAPMFCPTTSLNKIVWIFVTTFSD